MKEGGIIIVFVGKALITVLPDRDKTFHEFDEEQIPRLMRRNGPGGAEVDVELVYNGDPLLKLPPFTG